MIAELPSGWLVDDFLLINHLLKANNLLFPSIYIDEQYGGRSKGLKEKDAWHENDKFIQKKEKKKRKRPLNHGEQQMFDHHNEHFEFISQGKEELVEVGCLYFSNIRKQQKTKLLQYSDVIYPLDVVNNKKINSIPKRNLSKGLTYPDLTNMFVLNSHDENIIVGCMGHQFIIPAYSSFYMSDFNNIHWLCSFGKAYDLIVMDPPWENKSVKRSKRYSHIPEYDLKKIPMERLLSNNGLLVIWVTNKQKYIDFVYNVLCKHWKLEVIGHWHWVKLRSSGDYVFPMASTHKKPYETLLLLKRTGCTSFVDISFKKIICSIPIPLHSRKPNLKNILSGKTVDTKLKCLELFARNLTPGWTSWGNEVLKFQDIQYYDELDH